MLRGTVAAFAAAAGGATSITVLPFDHALGPPEPLARRIARNTQLVLLEESNLGRVADPAGGSWYVESLTEQLALKAWALVQEIERRGGMVRALREGWPQSLVAQTWRERQADIATRREPVTGVSEFAELAEPSRAVSPTAPLPGTSAHSADPVAPVGRGVRAAARPQRRNPGPHRRAAARVSLQSRPAGRIHGPGGLRHQSVRGRRVRHHHERADAVAGERRVTGSRPAAQVSPPSARATPIYADHGGDPRSRAQAGAQCCAHLPHGPARAKRFARPGRRPAWTSSSMPAAMFWRHSSAAYARGSGEAA